MIFLFIISVIGSKGEMVENLGIIVGVGSDIEKTSSNVSYNTPFLLYSFKSENKITAKVLIGKSKSIGETRENRQLRATKKSMIGLNKIFIFSQDSAIYGLKNYLDILLNNADINDRALCIVCKGKSEDMLKYDVKGYTSSAEYIEDMIKNLQQYNFFAMQYSVMDLIVRMDAEGRNALLPYMEIKDNTIETTGLAIFKGDKMVAKADMNETRIINILKENNVKGLLTLQNGSKYTNCYTYSKRKIKCNKKDGKYKYVINLDLKGDIVSNELYDNLYTDPKTLNKFEEDMKNYVEKMCNDSINKIKCQYKTDILDLGRVAAAKYGRGTGTDWNEAVCNSDIEVNVKFKVDTQGRGDY